MKNERLWRGNGVPSHVFDVRTADVFRRAMALFPTELAAAAARVRAVDLVDQLVNVSPGTYDHTTASLLAAASAWAYSDNEEVVRMLERRGLSNNCVTVKFENQGFLMDSLMHFLQSRDGRVAILVFRGSQLQPITNWLANINVSPDPFYAAGRVHGGFYRGILSVWPRVRQFLVAAKDGESLCRTAERDAPTKRCASESSKEDICMACGETSRLLEHDAQCREHARRRSVVVALEQALRFKLEALYITGHSLGGALAVLAAALIYSDEELRELRPLLRGIYTFGQPMVGDPVFAKEFERKFGNMLFRHVYGRDVMPHMPPRTAGSFEHFGQEYRSAPAGWISNGRPIVGQARFGGPALGFSLLAWFAEQFSLDPSLLFDSRSMAWINEKLVPPILRELCRFRYSLADHMPINYLRASRAVIPGSEFL